MSFQLTSPTPRALPLDICGSRRGSALDPGPGSPNPVLATAIGPFAVAPTVWSPPGELPGGGLTWSTEEPRGADAMTLSGAIQ